MKLGFVKAVTEEVNGGKQYRHAGQALAMRIWNRDDAPENKDLVYSWYKQQSAELGDAVVMLDCVHCGNYLKMAI